MNYISNYNNQIELVLLTFALLIATYLFITYKKVEKREMQRLALIIDELEQEKKQSVFYKKTSKKVTLLEKSTQQKLRTIKVDIANFNFTLHEVFGS